MSKNSLTLTVVANMTSNYSENLGNIASVQKVFKKGKIYSMRSRESLKNAIMVQSGMYDDLQTQVDGAAQKLVNDEFVNETRFHNNLYLATNRAKALGISVQEGTGKGNEVGLMPFQYEYDKSLKAYSMTIDLTMIGKDSNFDTEEASNEEKAKRVISLIDAVENISLVVRGNLDNAEPLFVVGGLSERKTHYFENVVNVKANKLIISDDLKYKINKGFRVGLLKGMTFENESEIVEKLKPISVSEFFDDLRSDVKAYYGC